MWPISSHVRRCLCTGIHVGYFPQQVCVCVDRGHFLLNVCCARLLSEECQAGSTPPGEDDVIANGFLFCEPVEWSRPCLAITAASGLGSPLARFPRKPGSVLRRSGFRAVGFSGLNSTFPPRGSFPPFSPLPASDSGGGTPFIVLVVMFGCTSWGERSCVALAGLTCASE